MSAITESVARRARPLVPLAVTALAAYVTWTLAGQTARGDNLLTSVLLAALAATAVVLRPAPVVLVILVLGASIYPGTVGAISLAGVRTDAVELLAYALVAGWVLHASQRLLTHVSPLATPTALLVAAAFVGAAVGLSRGASRYLVQGNVKTYLLYLLVLPLTSFFATSAAKARLEKWVIGICTFGSLYVIVHLALGRPVPSDDPTAFNTLGVATAAQRARPAMLGLLLVATLLVLARSAAEGATRTRSVQLAMFTVVWAYSFTRIAWVALVVGGVFVLRLRPGTRDTMRMLRVLTATALLLPLLATAATTGHLGPSAVAVSRRVSSVLDPRIVEESSFEDRASENSDAIRALRRDPVVGVGVGNLYGAKREVYDPYFRRNVLVDHPYAHNSYLYAYLQLGLLGMLALVFLAVRVVRVVRTGRRTATPNDAVRVVAGGGACLAIAVQALFQPQLLHRPSILALVVALALTDPPAEHE